LFAPLRRDSGFGARQPGQERRAIVAREIDTIIEIAAGDCEPRARLVRNKFIVYVRNRRQRFGARWRDGQRDLRRRKFFVQRRDRRRRQNQIANAFELNEQNIHP
jgi:hypothetical protein